MNQGMQIRITNTNNFPIEERFDGILYDFKPGVAVNMPYHAASHVFGIDFSQGIDRERIFTHIQKRWGWNRTTELKESRKKFDKIEMKILHMRLVEANDDEEQLPEPNNDKAAEPVTEYKAPAIQTRKRELTPRRKPEDDEPEEEAV